MEHGAITVTKFSQSQGLKENFAIMTSGLHAQKGICGGLSLLFLSSVKRNALAADFGGGNRYSKANFAFAEQAQQMGADNPIAVRNAAIHLGLAVQSAAIVWTQLDQAAKSSLSPTGYALVYSQDHVMGVAGKRGPNEKVRFFDPNYGMAVFPDSVKYVMFLMWFLANSNYDTSTVTIVHLA